MPTLPQPVPLYFEKIVKNGFFGPRPVTQNALESIRYYQQKGLKPFLCLVLAIVDVFSNSGQPLPIWNLENFYQYGREPSIFTMGRPGRQVQGGSKDYDNGWFKLAKIRKAWKIYLMKRVFPRRKETGGEQP